MDDKVKELLDKIRGTASVAADAAADTARVAGKKAGQMVDVAKLNVQLFDLNGDFNDILRRLGQVMYDTHRGQTPEGDPVTELLAEADETAAKVEEVKSRIADLRQSRSCPACGAPCWGAGSCASSCCGRREVPIIWSMRAISSLVDAISSSMDIDEKSSCPSSG